jgi:lipopolysaccharide/colanic/teichoic acid biosynthesis glycosyltransferase
VSRRCQTCDARAHIERLGLAELEPVAERVGGEEAAGAGDRVVGLCWYARRVQAVAQAVEIGDDETRMRLQRRRERRFDAYVQLLVAGTKPAAPTGLKRLRLVELLETEQRPVERTRRALAPCRRRDLDVVDSRDRHARLSTIDRVTSAPPPLEDTLVSGYTRLASDAPHRRIDLELRVLDILFSGLFGLLLAPIALLIALVVLLTSGRPILYRGERVGRRGHFFRMLKFRTLKRGAEERIGQYLGEELVLRTQEELTRVGRWLKASQLDEIPQLWNVLTGDMSFVGPRPIRPRFFGELAHELPSYWQRLVVRPGLTGLAQVRRGYETSMAEKLAHDLEWIADRSVRMYLRTLVVTGARVLRQSLGHRS